MYTYQNRKPSICTLDLRIPALFILMLSVQNCLQKHIYSVFNITNIRIEQQITIYKL